MAQSDLGRIFVAGHRGMVGSAIMRKLESENYREIVTCTRDELDLANQRDVQQFFRDQNIDSVFLAAAKVGGIYANNTFPADFIYDNLIIECNVIKAAHDAGVQRLLFLGSSCIYPKHAPQPIPEEALLDGKLEPTNEPYSVAKIAGIKLCESFSRQFGRDYRSLMPTNLYGPHDDFQSDNSHVVPALIRRIHEGKVRALQKVVIWGSGEPRREFLHVDDLADACLFFINLPYDVYSSKIGPMQSHINVGAGEDISIAELARKIGKIAGYKGQFSFDTTKPDGTPRKLLDVSRLDDLGWRSSIDLDQGLRETYEWFVSENADL